MKYRACVLRDPTQGRGPGRLEVWLSQDRLCDVPCFTGGEQLDPSKYGGITPPIAWKMVEPIAFRDHPNTRRDPMEMARIVPASPEEGERYSERTFAYDGPDDWPFMLHVAGVSTGCIIVPQEHWVQARESLNQAFVHSKTHDYLFLIEVLQRYPRQ